jgi:branched-chain amino acid transport system permease protein
MIHECVDQYACLAANINFNLEGLRIGFWQLTIDGLAWGAIYALVAVGYTLVFGVLRLINFAHSEIFMLAIGMSFVLQEFVHFVLPKLLKGYGGSNAQQPIILVQPKTQFHIFSATVSNVTIVIIVAALIFAVLTDYAINRTKFGRGIRAVAQDPTTATLMGVSRERIIMTTFLIGGLLAGAAALLYTLKVPQGIIYSGGFLLGIKAFSAAVLGGIGNLRGALLGGLLLGIMENYGQAVFGTQWRDVVAFVMLVLVLLVRPTGILGESLGKAKA